jgi:hypothetical protein
MEGRSTYLLDQLIHVRVYACNANANVHCYYCDTGKLSRYSNGLRDERPGFNSRQGQEIFSPSP